MGLINQIIIQAIIGRGRDRTESDRQGGLGLGQGAGTSTAAGAAAAPAGHATPPRGRGARRRRRAGRRSARRRGRQPGGAPAVLETDAGALRLRRLRAALPVRRPPDRVGPDEPAHRRPVPHHPARRPATPRRPRPGARHPGAHRLARAPAAGHPGLFSPTKSSPCTGKNWGRVQVFSGSIWVMKFWGFVAKSWTDRMDFREIESVNHRKAIQWWFVIVFAAWTWNSLPTKSYRR